MTGDPGKQSDDESVDPWETEDDDASELSVPSDAPGVDLLRFIRDEAARPSRVEEEARFQIAVRYAPPGFGSILSQLARELGMSYSRLVRHALDHGIARLDQEPWISSVRHAYYDNRADAMSTGDPEALSRLNQRVHYAFLRSQPDRTTLAVSRETVARVAELAIVCGMYTPALGVLTVLVSALTLPNNRGYRVLLRAEAKAFEKYVTRRARVLRLGE